MSEGKHTSGPWQAVRTKTAKHVRWHIACSTHVVADTVGDCKANADLIAAAPDMLTALKVTETLRTLGYTQKAVQALADDGISIPLVPPYGNDLANYAAKLTGAAIAKAEGS